jgi:tripartite-type tricarboxylate transporter receptor subunit TctC
MLAAVAAGAAVPALLPTRALAQTSDVINIVSPYAPGGGTDILSRILSKRFTEIRGVSAVVENRAGANGSIGAAYVARANPDGKTLLVVPAGFAANPFIYKDLPFNTTKDLAGVSLLASGPLILVVNPKVPAKSVKELIQYAKSMPGALNIGSAGVGSLPSLCAGLLNQQAKVNIVEVPYKGSGLAVTDLLSGQLQCYFMNVLQALPLIRSGQLRGLAVTTPKRSPSVPDLPTLIESGVEDFDMSNWYGLLTRGGTPKPILHKLSEDVATALKDKEIEKQLADQAMEVVASTAEEFDRFLKNEMAKYEKVIKAAGIKVG